MSVTRDSPCRRLVGKPASVLRFSLARGLFVRGRARIAANWSASLVCPTCRSVSTTVFARRSRSLCDPSAIARTMRLRISAFMVFYPRHGFSHSSPRGLCESPCSASLRGFGRPLDEVSPAIFMFLRANLVPSFPKRGDATGNRRDGDADHLRQIWRRVSARSDQAKYMVQPLLDLQ